MKSFFLQLVKLPDEIHGFSEERKAIFTNRMLLLTAFLGSVHYLISFINNSIVGGGHTAFVFFIATCILYFTINSFGFYKAAKITGFFSLNVILFNLCGSQSFETGIQLNLISVALVTLVVFGYKDFFLGILFTLLPLSIYLITYHYKISIFPYKEMSSHQANIQFILNMILFISICSYLFFILIRQNFKIEIKLREKNNELSELNAAKDKLFSIIGHDLKEPLNTLSSFSHLLSFSTLSEQETKTLSKDLNGSLVNVKNLLENLLEWSRSQSKSIDFKPAKFEINSVVEENLGLCLGPAKRKNLVLKNNTNGEVFVNAHQYSIDMVIRNLLSNAIKFTKEGGSITITTTNAEMVTVTIQDTGIGMASSTVQQLFQLGHKISTLGTAKEKGTGLGLILCKDFVEKNGGSISVDSKEGIGTHFYFTIPRG